MNKGWIALVVTGTLLVIAYIVFHFICSSKWARKKQLIPDTIEGIGVFCLILIRTVPRTVFVRLPMWLGLPIVINVVVTLILFIGALAKPVFKEIFGVDQDKSNK